jgi:hypothetical protein
MAWEARALRVTLSCDKEVLSLVGDVSDWFVAAVEAFFGCSAEIPCVSGVFNPILIVETSQFAWPSLIGPTGKKL